MAYGPLKDALDAFNLLWTLVRSLCLLPDWGYFGHFNVFLDFSSTFQESTGDFEGFLSLLGIFLNFTLHF